MVFSYSGAGSSRRRQRGLVACVLKPPCWMRPQPLLSFLMGCLPRGWRVPETHKDTVKTREKEKSKQWCSMVMKSLHSNILCRAKKKKNRNKNVQLHHPDVHMHAAPHTALGHSCQTHWHCCSSLLSPAPKWLSSRKPPYRRLDNRPYLILWRS